MDKGLIKLIELERKLEELKLKRRENQRDIYDLENFILSKEIASLELEIEDLKNKKQIAEEVPTILKNAKKQVIFFGIISSIFAEILSLIFLLPIIDINFITVLKNIPISMSLPTIISIGTFLSLKREFKQFNLEQIENEIIEKNNLLELKKK